MTERVIPSDVRQELEKGSTSIALLGFLTIVHPRLSEPIRLVSDVHNYMYDGDEYVGLYFDWSIVTDTEDAPTAKLVVSNVDRRIGISIRQSEVPPTIGLKILSSSDFDLSVVPRTEVGTASIVYAFDHFTLRDVEADLTKISGTIQLFDPSGEPWPYKRATNKRCPGLFV